MFFMLYHGREHKIHFTEITNKKGFKVKFFTESAILVTKSRENSLCIRGGTCQKEH